MSVGRILDKSCHLTGIDIVAETVGLAEKIDAIVLPREF
jgi:hypothetical protein